MEVKEKFTQRRVPTCFVVVVVFRLIFQLELNWNTKGNSVKSSTRQLRPQCESWGNIKRCRKWKTLIAVLLKRIYITYREKKAHITTKVLAHFCVSFFLLAHTRRQVISWFSRSGLLKKEKHNKVHKSGISRTTIGNLFQEKTQEANGFLSGKLVDNKMWLN